MSFIEMYDLIWEKGPNKAEQPTLMFYYDGSKTSETVLNKLFDKCLKTPLVKHFYKADVCKNRRMYLATKDKQLPRVCLYYKKKELISIELSSEEKVLNFIEKVKSFEKIFKCSAKEVFSAFKK